MTDMTDVKRLSDDELWTRTRTLAQDERRVTLEVLRHLREVEARGLHFDRGYPSLYEYTVRELQYSEGAAYRRVQAMRLIQEVPEIEQKVASGILHLTALTKLQTRCKGAPTEHKRELLRLMEGKGNRETDQILANQAPILPRESTRWLSADTIELRMHLDKPAFTDFETLKSIKSHNSDAQTYSGTFKRLIELGKERWDPNQRGAPPQRRSTASGNVEYADPRYIPPQLRWDVQQRDQKRCAFQDPLTGKICASTQWLQIDHIQPVALGGKTELSNLRLLCGAHNKHRARKTFGPASSGGSKGIGNRGNGNGNGNETSTGSNN